MPAGNHPEINLKRMQAAAGPYPLEAFEFVRAGLGHTAGKVHHAHVQSEQLEGTGRHVSGQQLCIGLLDFALDRYGMLAPTVLERWKVQRTEDFGRIVFALIDEGLMSKTPEDRLDDFKGVYDFAEVFSADAMRRRIGQCRG